MRNLRQGWVLLGTMLWGIGAQANLLADEPAECEVKPPDCCKNAEPASAHTGSVLDSDRGDLSAMIRAEIERGFARIESRLERRHGGRMEPPRPRLNVDSWENRLRDARRHWESVRSEIENRLNEAAERAPEKVEQLRKEFRERGQAAHEKMERLAEEGRRHVEALAQMSEEEARQARKRFFERTSQHLAEIEKGVREFGRKLQQELGLPQTEEEFERRLEGVRERMQARGSEVAKRMLETPEGRELAVRGLEAAQEHMERFMRQMDDLLHQNEKLQETVRQLSGRLDEMERRLSEKPSGAGVPPPPGN